MLAITSEIADEHSVVGMKSKRPKGALEPLIRQIKSEDPAERTKAARALGDSKKTEGVAFLVIALQDKNRHVRRAASAALENVRSEEAVVPLCTALKDTDWFVRWNAALALGQIGDKGWRTL